MKFSRPSIFFFNSSRLIVAPIDFPPFATALPKRSDVLQTIFERPPRPAQYRVTRMLADGGALPPLT